MHTFLKLAVLFLTAAAVTSAEAAPLISETASRCTTCGSVPTPGPIIKPKVIQSQSPQT